MSKNYIELELKDLRDNADTLGPLLAADGAYLAAEGLLMLTDVNGRLADLINRLRALADGKPVELDTPHATASASVQTGESAIRGRRRL